MSVCLVGMMLAGCSSTGPAGAGTSSPAPILLIHGNGESSGFWMTFVWRLESNGYPSDRIFALDFERPVSRSTGPGTSDRIPAPGRSSTADQRAELAAAIDRVREETGAPRVVLIGHSRAGNAIRNYLWNDDASKVERVVFAATTTHGIFSNPEAPFNEFNGMGRFVRSLERDGRDVPIGVPALALRSDENDLWFQKDGRFLGRPGMAIGVGPDAPAVHGAVNRVLEGADHKQVALGREAFGRIFEFVTGSEPHSLDVVAAEPVILDGPVHAPAGGSPSNRPVPGARVDVYRVSPETGERLGDVAHSVVTPASGRWGPFRAETGAYYEFVLRTPGSERTTHVYREPFARSSDLVRLTPTPMGSKDARSGSLIVMTRPRGLFDPRNDRIAIDGRAPRPRAIGVYGARIAPGETVPATAARELGLTRSSGPVETLLDDVRLVVRAWPAEEGHVTVVEYHE